MKSRHPFAKKSLGQNFLEDQGVIERILQAFDPRPEDTVLEIGPGRGALTERLIDRAGRVYALEFDRDLAPMLRERFGGRENFVLVEGDAMKIDFRGLDAAGDKLRLIANLPYNISTAILQRLFSCAEIFEDCVLMFQREVVERITAKPCSSERGYLTVLVEAHFSVERLFDVAPSAFRPVPKVWSSVVRFVPTERPLPDPERFRALVAAGFAQKRKTILNNLKNRYPDADPALRTAGIDSSRRAETLSLEEWIRVAASLESNPAPPSAG
ncbi:MAG TPA: 16S rRNA (adenine(1518)-N(6)/adenine(1519)-N(6))-dimethyltransferase RsmA [Pyrinomonadaceae bacterium]|nr:16S rRNA (adenine(1518)-N(6)/adenine(1519)-N(6))-dimethyltransferase RsmA [Pyrinomonadaceae bacterium]